MSSRRSERPRKRPTPIDAGYEESLVSAALPRSASGSTTKMTEEPGSSAAGPSSQGKARPKGKSRTKASRRRRVEEDDVPEEEDVVREEEEPPRSVTPEKKHDPEEEEDPVWQEFSQEYYEVVEQLPLEIHRNFALLRELDDQTQRTSVTAGYLEDWADTRGAGQTGQLLELIRKYVVRRLPSPVPEELEVPLLGGGEPIRAESSQGGGRGVVGSGDEGIKAETSDGNPEAGEEAAATSTRQNGVEPMHGSLAPTTNGHSEAEDAAKPLNAEGPGTAEMDSVVEQDVSKGVAPDQHPPQPVIHPAQDSTIASPAPVIPLAERQDPTDVTNNEGDTKSAPSVDPAENLPLPNGTQTQASPTKQSLAAHSTDLPPTSTQRVETLKARQAEMYAHRLVPAMASRDLLPEIGKLARDMLRSADEKVGIAIGTYNTVDRHIRSLDAALQAQQAALNLGIRQDTLPSKAVTGGTHGEENPSSTLQTGAKGDTSADLGSAPRVGKNWRKGMKGYHSDQTRAVDALDVGLTTTHPTGKTAVKVVGEPEPIVLGYIAAHNFDLAIDPNEPRYCFCQNVSYGEMVGCENLDCPNGGWFHLGCLGMTSAPTGKWWCDQCKPTDKASGQKRKKRKIKF